MDFEILGKSYAVTLTDKDKQRAIASVKPTANKQLLSIEVGSIAKGSKVLYLTATELEAFKKGLSNGN